MRTAISGRRLTGRTNENGNHRCKCVLVNDPHSSLAAYSDPSLPLPGEPIANITSFVTSVAVKEIP